MSKTQEFHPIGKQLVPVSEEGFLLEGPYGPAHFVVGRVILDFVELPDGDIYVTTRSPDGMLHQEDLNLRRPPSEIVEAVYHLIGRISDELARRGLEHDAGRNSADRWYLMRAIAKHVGVAAYVDMTELQLRGI